MVRPNFEEIVDLYYRGLFRFAYGLSRCEATASDLTQQTFYIWAKKGHQLREPGKVKSWLFTTLRREFLDLRRRSTSHPHIDMEVAERELPDVAPNVVRDASVNEIMDALQELNELHREPLGLFHVNEHSYKEIAEILEIPIGTVMSRIARGREQLYRMLADSQSSRGQEKTNVVQLPTARKTG